jgi:putative NADH-flavin reductase
MKLCVFGGTGATGRNVIQVAKSKNYEIVAVARRPEVIETLFPDIQIVRGDVFQPETIKAAIGDSDAVISTIGPSGREKGTTIYSVGDVNIATTMQELRKRRLIVAASLIGFDLQADLSWEVKLFSRMILQPILGSQYRDTAKMKEKMIQLDSLDWTLVGLPRLTNGKPRGSFRSSIGSLHHPFQISRVDLADYLISIIDESKTFRQWTEVSY